jgi:hypothetical protein
MDDPVDALFQGDIYRLPQTQKEAALLDALNRLTALHRAGCPGYRALLDAYGAGAEQARSLAEVPFLHASVFKSHLLASVPESESFKTLHSSGTTGQAVSRIVLDTRTADLQKRAMVRIMQSFLGRARLPMIVVDHPSVIKRRDQFSARGAGILGMMNFGRSPIYALRDETMEIDTAGLSRFIERHGDGPIFLFGFTFMVWKFLVRAIEQTGIPLSIPQGILVHSGGWKKLQDEAVSSSDFRQRLEVATGISRVHNFYGMVEQVGSIFVECENGRLHAPEFSDVLIRRAMDWSVADIGEEGVIEVLSALPHSYPGHALITEDRGRITGIDDCPCGRSGKTIEVLGRLPKAEVRGCSDTFELASDGVS